MRRREPTRHEPGGRHVLGEAVKTMLGNIKSVRTKILAGFLLVVALTAAVGVVGIRGMSDIEDDAAAIYDENLVPVTALGAVAANLHQGTVYALTGIPHTPPPALLQVQVHTAPAATATPTTH